MYQRVLTSYPQLKQSQLLLNEFPKLINTAKQTNFHYQCISNNQTVDKLLQFLKHRRVVFNKARALKIKSIKVSKERLKNSNLGSRI